MSRALAAIGNILIDEHDDAWGIYRIPTFSYPWLAEALKLQLFEQLTAFACGVRADFTLWRVSRLAGDATEDAGFGRTPEVYLAVALAEPDTRGIGGRLLRPLIRERLTVPMRLAFPRVRVERLHAQEQNVAGHVAATLSGRPATTREIAWLLARPTHLGTGEPDTDPNGPAHPIWVDDTAVVEPLASSPLRGHPAGLTEHADHLAITPGAGEAAFVTCLDLGTLPDGLEFPGRAELLFRPLDRCAYPVDAALHVEWIANATAMKRAQRTILDAENQSTEQLSTGRIADSRLDDQLQTAVDFKRYLEHDQSPPMLRSRLTLTFAARSPAELERAASELTGAFAPTHARRPSYSQLALWRSAYRPRMPRGAGQYLTVEQFAALMPVAADTVGDRLGPRIGELRSSGRTVRLDLRTASQASRPPSILCVGTLGSGKTVTCQMLAVQAAASGSLIIDVDPKPDHQLDTLPELAGRVHAIDLADTHRHAGLLDPLQITDTGLREEIASSFYTQLLDADAKTKAALRSALTECLSELEPSSPRLIQLLQASKDPHATAAGEQLAAWAQSGLARLALAPQAAGAAAPAEADVITIRCRALTLPSAQTARSEHTENERISAAIMRLIAAYALRLATGNRHRHKLLLIDEAWLLLGSSDGRALIDRLNRTGRSENATLLLATQQLGDADAIHPLIGTHFIFGLETPTEAEQAARLLGLDHSPELTQLLLTQRAGKALMRDIHGQTASVQITPAPGLLAHLDTTPTQEQP